MVDSRGRRAKCRLLHLFIPSSNDSSAPGNRTITRTPAGGSLPDLALRFILHHPAVSTTIPGMRRLRNVDANLAAGEAPPLSPEMIAALRAHRWDRDWPIP